jgi:putative sigma-54 modulation protein
MGMPNVITHGLLAKETLKQLPVSVVKDAIAKYPQAYLFGSNGPDFLFYYNVWPWLNQKENHRVGEFGEMMHRSQINEFTDAMVLKTMELTDKAKTIFTSFVAGYLTHWSLDTISHPFVFYRTGKISGKTKYWHFRFESMLDSLMVKEVFKEDLSKYPTRNFMKLSSEEKQVIASGVSETFTSVYQEEMKVSEALKSMNHAYGVLKFLFDPNTRIFPFVQNIMRVNIHGKNLTITDAMFDRVNKKLSFLEKYFNIDEDTIANTVVRTYPTGIKLEITILTKVGYLRAEVVHEDFYAALDVAMDKLEDQIRRQKTRLSKKHREKLAVAFLKQEELIAKEEEPKAEPVRTKTVVAEKMDLDEAIMRMEMLGHSFFIYTDNESELIAVVYKRNDGGYGLLETEPAE